MKIELLDGYVILNDKGNTYLGRTASKICCYFCLHPEISKKEQLDYINSNYEKI